MTRFKATTAASLAVLAAIGLYPLTLPAGGLNSLSLYSIYFVWVALAESWNLAGGYAGMVNLGLVGFFALGSVVGAMAMAAGFPFVVSVGLAGFAGATAALALYPAFRLKGFYFAIATLVVPLVIKASIELTTDKSDFRVPQQAILSSAWLYYSGLAISGATVFGIFLLMRARAGLGLRALGDDETASESIGIDVLKFKTIALVLSGAVAGVAGAYYLQIIGTVSTTLFTNVDFSLFPIFMVIIGGISTLDGPVVGAFVFSAINYGVTSILPDSTLDTFLLSLLIIGIAVFLPSGLVAVLRDLSRRGFRMPKPRPKDWFRPQRRTTVSRRPSTSRYPIGRGTRRRPYSSTTAATASWTCRPTRTSWRGRWWTTSPTRRRWPRHYSLFPW